MPDMGSCGRRGAHIPAPCCIPCIDVLTYDNPVMHSSSQWVFSNPWPERQPLHPCNSIHVRAPKAHIYDVGVGWVDESD